MAYRRGSLNRDVHMLRDLGDRVRRLEHRPRKVKVGPWRLAVDPDTGDLVAIHRPTGVRRVLAAPGDPPRDDAEEPGEETPGG